MSASGGSVHADMKEVEHFLETRKTDGGRKLLSRINIQYGRNFCIMEAAA